MDDRNIIEFIHTLHNIPIPEYTSYWPPEGFICALDNPCTWKDWDYNELVTKHFTEKYKESATDVLMALKVLGANNEAFENRINGTIKDDWLTSKTFKPIANDCIKVLKSIDKRKPYQEKLIEIFENM